MIVILTKDVKGTGKSGDVVKVSDGYARNMLIPRGLAKPATEGNVKSLNKQKAIMEEKQEAARQAAVRSAEKLESTTVEIETRGGENGKLFGSVTTKDIAEAVKAQTDMNIDKKKIVLDSPIKETGITTVTVKLYPEVSAQMKVRVTAKN